MSYYVEAYVNYDEYIDCRNRFTLIFTSKEEFERVFRKYELFKNLYIEAKFDVESFNNSSEDDDISS